MAVAKVKSSNKKKVIFVVEDDSFLVQAYQIKFQKEGIDVWVATDGEEALSFLKKEPPDVVLLDIMLPKVSGFSVLEAIRKDEKWKNVPVVILSNLGQQQDMERGRVLGVSEYIVKANAKINDVVEKVKKIL